MRGMVPCGACRALVPSAIGCVHWRPRMMTGTSASDRAARERAKRARDRTRAELSPEELTALRTRNNAASKRSRDRKREQLLPEHARAAAQLTRIAGLSG